MLYGKGGIGMVVNKKPSGRAVSAVTGITVSTIISLIITLLTSFVLSLMISFEYVDENALGYGAMLILLLSSMVGAAIANQLIKRRRMFVCVLNGLVYYSILLMGTALLLGGRYQGIGVTAALVIGGSAAAGLLCGLCECRCHNKHNRMIRSR